MPLRKKTGGPSRRNHKFIPQKEKESEIQLRHAAMGWEVINQRDTSR
jgi:hypothetical protein